MSQERSEDEKDVRDFGFAYPFEYLKLVVSLLKLSNYQCWPEAGGTNEQALSLVEDVARYLYLERAVEEGRVFIPKYEKIDPSTPKIVPLFGRRGGR